MRVLLDTHSFLWFVTADSKPSAAAQRIITPGSNKLLLSVASVWEIAIKLSIGRLPIPEPLDTFIPEQLRINRVELLPIELEHTFEVARLPLHHRDPFDRMITAQGVSEGMPILSADGVFDSYAIKRIW